MKIGGWGNYPVATTELCSVHTPAAVRSLLAEERSVLARGAGRSYGDAAIGTGRTIDLTKLDRFIAFEEASGLLTVEAGVMLSDIIATLLPRGFFPPVVPGTRFVTVGGMIASHVHGKNHHRDGGFGHHVEQIRLALADGSIVECSRSTNEALFRATVGGMGLTGIILAASFKMRRTETGFIRQETLVAGDLDEILKHCEASRDWLYTVAWIDGLAKGTKFGRGLVFRGDHARRDEIKGGRESLGTRHRPQKRVPFFFPKNVLNRTTVKAFNEIYYRRGASTPANIVDWERYFFPLDAVSEWNRIYGAQGFIQHQCVVPKSQSRDAIGMLLERISQRGHPSFLAVLKLLGPDGDGLLGFPMEGYTLAIDFPANAKSLALADELDQIVVAYGGRVYLAKDARQARATFESGYPNLATFRQLRRDTRAQGKFSSYQSERLGI